MLKYVLCIENGVCAFETGGFEWLLRWLDRRHAENAAEAVIAVDEHEMLNEREREKD